VTRLGTVTIDQSGAVVRDASGTELARLGPDAVLCDLGRVVREHLGPVVLEGNGRTLEARRAPYAEWLTAITRVQEQARLRALEAELDREPPATEMERAWARSMFERAGAGE
jgi:hypothetical protein